jgi:DNA polymerase-4
MNLIHLPFSTKTSSILHIDFNSCFASIEQLADPYLRGRPVAVAAYTSPGACILSPSVEAKQLGIKTGMLVKEGRMRCKDLVVLEPEPNKYRSVHLRLRELLSVYSDDVTPKSIDEFVVDIAGYPAEKRGAHALAQEIKMRIRQEIGQSLTVSIGIAPNWYLAKLAAGLKKPDGLEEINIHNHEAVFKRLRLTDLPYIKERNASRLFTQGITTVIEFFRASARVLRAAFKSREGWYWYLRLRGQKVDDQELARKSYGNSFVLPKALRTPDELAPILHKLVQKTGQRMRRGGHACRGVHIGLSYTDGTAWSQQAHTARALIDSRAIFAGMLHLLRAAPAHKPVRAMSEDVFDLQSTTARQGELFVDTDKEWRLVQAIDDINERWGDFVLTPARMLGTERLAPDRVAFGNVRELGKTMWR